MADLRFFTRGPILSLQAIADISGAKLSSGADPNYLIDDVAPLHTAKERNVSFLDNIRYKEAFQNTSAGACFVSPKMAEFAPRGLVLLVSDNPYKSYALTAQEFYPDEKPESFVSQKASIHPDADIADGCTIEEGVVIQAGARIGSKCWIEPNAVIGKGVKMGSNCRIGPNATISHTIMGEGCRVYPGARIGQDGFGFAIDPAGHVKVPQLGRVIVEDHVEIGANTTIDRGAGPDTVIGQGAWIDNLVQIGHNVKVGKGCVIVAQVGVSGSTVIEDYAVLAGQVGVAGHLTVGSGARIAAQSGVMRDVPAGEEYFGSPAGPKREEMRKIVALNRLIQDKK